MLNCTMPKCRGKIGGLTGLDEIRKLIGHFQKAHKISLSMEEALEIRINLEDGKEPNLIRAMLGTERISAEGK